MNDGVEELRRRRAMALEMGGPDSVAFHHGRGKLTVRERLDLLVDAGSRREFGMLAGQGDYDEQDRLEHFTPKGEVNAMATIDGRPVVVSGGDFTVRGGSASTDHGGLGQEYRPAERARDGRCPTIAQEGELVEGDHGLDVIDVDGRADPGRPANQQGGHGTDEAERSSGDRRLVGRPLQRWPVRMTVGVEVPPRA